MAWLILAIGLYFGAALAGSLIAANAGWRQPDTGVEIWVETNGVHTGIVMPLANAQADWRDLLRPEDLRDPRYYSTHVLVAWGEARFYRETETWADLTPAIAWNAATGSDEVLMHVDFLRRHPRAVQHRPERTRAIQLRLWPRRCVLRRARPL